MPYFIAMNAFNKFHPSYEPVSQAESMISRRESGHLEAGTSAAVEHRNGVVAI
jgi:hypothetical protein